VYVNANVHALQTVLIALRPLARGTKLQASDVTTARWPLHQLRGAPLSSISEVVGLVVRNTIAAQEPLLAAQLCLVCKGDSVRMVVADTRFSVGIAGIAAGFGHIGERIEVVNPSSRRHVFGFVSGPGQVQVNAVPTSP
jgi:flagella basal body P-ring formation protein FlgA